MSATVHLLPILAVIFLNAVGAGAASGETGVAAADTTSQTLTFEQDVRPILKASCFQCHGEEEELRGGLDLRLVRDLKQRGMLDSTLVHWGGEMGRLPLIQFRQGNNRSHIGRDHNTYGFSMWVAGGGLRGGYVHGRTDDMSHYAIEGVVHHYDWLATVLHQFGLDHEQLKFRNRPRDFSLVDNPQAQVQRELLV